MRRLGLRSRAGGTPAQPSQARRSRDAGPTRPDRALRGRVTPASRRAPCRRARCRRSFPCDGWRQRRARGHAEHPAKRPKHAPRPGRGGEQGGHAGVGQQVLKLRAITSRLRHQPDEPGKPVGQPLARAGRPGAGRTRPGDAARWAAPRRRPVRRGRRNGPPCGATGSRPAPAAAPTRGTPQPATPPPGTAPR